MFDDIASPYGGTEYLASQLLTPDGRVLLTDPPYGHPHWFQWEGHPSWKYDALRVWTGGASCCMWYWFVLKTPPYYMLPRFDGGVSDIELVDPNNDGTMEFVTLEDTYSFGTDTVHRTIPKLLWKMTDEGAVLARELMQEWKLSDERLTEIKDELASASVSSSYNEWTQLITKTIITQYYSTGDLDAARMDYDYLWSELDIDREYLWTKLVSQMACSQFGVDGVDCDGADQGITE